MQFLVVVWLESLSSMHVKLRIMVLSNKRDYIP